MAQFGPLTMSGMVMVAIWLVFRGHLVPRVYYDEMRADRDRWKEACEREEETSRELISQNSLLLDASLTTQRIVESLPPGEGA